MIPPQEEVSEGRTVDVELKKKKNTHGTANAL